MKDKFAPEWREYPHKDGTKTYYLFHKSRSLLGLSQSPHEGFEDQWHVSHGFGDDVFPPTPLTIDGLDAAKEYVQARIAEVWSGLRA